MENKCNNLALRICFVLFIALFLSGCSDEKEDSQPNLILVNGFQVKVSDALLICQGESPGDEKEGYGCSLFFFTKGIKFSSTGSLLGRGDLVFFDFFSPSYDLAPGVYTFDSDKSFIPNTFYYGGFILNYSLVDNMCQAFDFFNGGTITVARESNIYEIKVDCIALSDGSITGYYKGPLNFIDRSN